MGLIWSFGPFMPFGSFSVIFRPFVPLRLIWALLVLGQKGKNWLFWDLWANLASLATMPQYGRHTHGLDGSVRVGGGEAV